MRDEFVAGDVELHVVDALAAAEPNRPPDFVDAVGDHAEALGVHVLFSLVAEAAGRRDLGAGGAIARAGEIAVLDFLTHHHVDAQFGGSRGIGGGEAMIEDQRRVAAGAQQMLLGRDFPQVLIASGADERQVAVALHQARHQELPVPVDHLGRAFAADRVAPARDGLDPVVLHDDFAGIFLIVDPVPDGYVAE